MGTAKINGLAEIGDALKSSSKSVQQVQNDLKFHSLQLEMEKLQQTIAAMKLSAETQAAGKTPGEDSSMNFTPGKSEHAATTLGMHTPEEEKEGENFIQHF